MKLSPSQTFSMVEKLDYLYCLFVWSGVQALGWNIHITFCTKFGATWVHFPSIFTFFLIIYRIGTVKSTNPWVAFNSIRKVQSCWEQQKWRNCHTCHCSHLLSLFVCLGDFSDVGSLCRRWLRIRALSKSIW